MGAVSYLNTRPLVYGLEELTAEIDLVFDLPSRLADRLANSELDVALIPSIELLEHGEYRIISDACIACRGPVLSVKLLSRGSLKEIRTLALDEGSRTSGVLARILLDAHFGICPEIHPLPVNACLESWPTDALLVIGDRAIHPPADCFVEQWDLGEQWCQWSGLPFVFAAWAGRKDRDWDHLEDVLSRARNAGVSNLQRIAARHSLEVGLSFEQTLSYLRDNLHFTLGDAERRGLELYHRSARKLCQASETKRLVCHDP